MFVDLQVNGYGGVDFNSAVTPDQLHQAFEHLRRDQVHGLLATIITDDLPQMCQRLKLLAAARQSDPLIREMLLGFHIEGPFISNQPGYVGAHPLAHVRPADCDSMQRLLDAADGLTRLVTLAPEVDPDQRVTRMLADQGITVSAGHCDPDLGTLKKSIDAGLSMVTHLGNACPLELPRHDNVIQRLLSQSDRLWFGLIADGIHLPLFVLRNFLNAIGVGRAVVVSDAIAAAGCGPGTYQLGDRQVTVDSHLATWAADGRHLVGSACPLRVMARTLTEDLELQPDVVSRLTCHNPLAAIGLASYPRG